MDIFWMKQVNLGKLHICLARNDAIEGLIRTGIKKKFSIRLNRVNMQFFWTFRFGSRFLNIDWV